MQTFLRLFKGDVCVCHTIFTWRIRHRIVVSCVPGSCPRGHHAPESERDNAAEALALMEELEGLVDLVERETVRDVLLYLELALQVVLDELGHVHPRSAHVTTEGHLLARRRRPPYGRCCCSCQTHQSTLTHLSTWTHRSTSSAGIACKSTNATAKSGLVGTGQLTCSHRMRCHARRAP